MTNATILGLCLKKRRIHNCMTQKDIAKELGISYQMYQNYEYGNFKPKPARMKELCEIMHFDYKKTISMLYVSEWENDVAAMRSTLSEISA